MAALHPRFWPVTDGRWRLAAAAAAAAAAERQ
jgi:hypothetical protein